MTLFRLLVLLFIVAPLSPGMAEWDVDGIEELLPHHETEAERLRWEGREHEMPYLDRSDPPPMEPVRNCGEWEPCTGVLIRYPLGLPYSLLRDFDDDVILHVVVSSGNLNSAQNNLANNGVDMDKVEFLVKPNDSIWVRDYGPWFVFDGNLDITIIDHFYNRPHRPNDNMIPFYFGEQQGIPVISHDMWHTGGNYMTDGAHISSSTYLVYSEAAQQNGMNQTEVDELMFDYYGVNEYHVLDYIESGGIHHIDTWAKFLDEETVLLKEVWPSHHTYDDLEQRATLLASLEASTGRNYQVHRVYCYNIGGGAPASYTNSLFLNDAIYVPFFGNTTYDDQAKAAYEEAAPGYLVRGYYYGGWYSDDALHCRAKGMMDRDMLRVAHVPFVEEQTGPVTVTATVIDHSEEGLSAVELNYRQDGDIWTTLPMIPAGADQYEAVIPIPVPTSDTTTEYYIHAESFSGRHEGMPRVEPNHWYSFPHSSGGSSVGETLDPVSSLGPRSYPNPFSPKTTFSFELRHAGTVELVVFDVQGRLVRRLIDGLRPAGQTKVDWDGRDDDGDPLAAGTYYFRLRAAGLQYSRPVTLLK
jgi:agmatine/peptidylarginine deiminase